MQPSLRAIICDDDSHVRHVVAMLLDHCGFEVVAELDRAPHLIPAVVAAEPDIVVLDLSLPGMSGLDVIEELVALAPSVAVVVFSAYDECREEAVAAGAREFVDKPDFEALETTLRTLRAVPSAVLASDEYW